MHGALVKHCKKQVSKLRKDPLYQRTLCEYKRLLKSGQKDSAQAEAYAAKLAAITREYGLSEYQLHRFIKPMQHRFRNYIGSNPAQKAASAVWRSVSSILYGNGKAIRCKTPDECVSMKDPL